jgi:hypothetical protein
MELKNRNDLKPESKKQSTNKGSDYKSSKKSMNRGFAGGRPILSLLLGLGFLSVILLATMFTTGTAAKATKTTAAKYQKGIWEEPEPGNGDTVMTVLGVLTAIDTTEKKIELYDINKKGSVSYTYSGGTDITDKYGQAITIRQIPIGTMVEATHQPNQMKLKGLTISTKAWEYVGVNNMSINRSSKVMQIATTKYKYTDDIIILDGDSFIPVTNLAEQDVLTVWGYEETIWSIRVTRGHGTVRLVDYESFIGDFITIGYEAMQQIVEDMVITVREGNFNLTVENAKYTAMKNITVVRNQETEVSLSDLGPEAAKIGRVTFEIKPFGADLFIDGELTSYANPIELEYGTHDLLVSLDGYRAYDGKLTVDAAGKTIRIELFEESSDEDTSVSELNIGSVNGAGDNSSSTGNSESNQDTDSGDDDIYIDQETDMQSEDFGPDLAENISNDEFEEDEDHKIYIQNPIGASVYLNGEYMCDSPGSFKKLIGTHILTFIKEGYETVSYKVEVHDDGKNLYLKMRDMVKKK